MDYITPISPVHYAPSARITKSAPHAKCDENTCNQRVVPAMNQQRISVGREGDALHGLSNTILDVGN